MALTSGRSKVLPASTKPVKAIASKARSAPAQAPTAAEHHNVAATLLHDHACAKKAYTCDDIRDDLRGTDVTVQVHTDVHEGRSAHGDQRMRSQTAAALSVL